MSFVSVQRTYAAATRREAEELTHPHELILVTLTTLRQSLDLMSQQVIEPELFARSKSKSLTAIYILQQQPATADLQNLERIGAIPKETSTGKKITNEAARAAAEFWNVTEMDLPVQAVLFSSFVMQ